MSTSETNILSWPPRHLSLNFDPINGYCINCILDEFKELNDSFSHSIEGAVSYWDENINILIRSFNDKLNHVDELIIQVKDKINELRKDQRTFTPGTIEYSKKIIYDQSLDEYLCIKNHIEKKIKILDALCEEIASIKDLVHG